MHIPRSQISFAFWALCLIGTLLTGCGSSTSGVAVSGSVTVDGESLPHGSIIFMPKTKESGPQAVATIVNGIYALDAANGPGMGNYSVKIYAQDPLPFSPDDPKSFFAHSRNELPSNSIPPEYNTRSMLEVFTKADDNTFNFSIDTNEGN